MIVSSCVCSHQPLPTVSLILPKVSEDNSKVRRDPNKQIKMAIEKTPEERQEEDSRTVYVVSGKRGAKETVIWCWTIVTTCHSWGGGGGGIQ